MPALAEIARIKAEIAKLGSDLKSCTDCVEMLTADCAVILGIEKV
jgi:hypothetical protein